MASVALLDVDLEVARCGDGDEEVFSNFLCCSNSKRSRLELLFPAAFNSLCFDFREDNDLLVMFLLITFEFVLFSSISSPLVLPLFVLPFTSPKEDFSIYFIHATKPNASG